MDDTGTRSSGRAFPKRLLGEIAGGVILGGSFALLRESSQDGGPLPGLEGLVLAGLIIGAIAITGLVLLVRQDSARRGAGLLLLAGIAVVSLNVVQELV